MALEVTAYTRVALESFVKPDDTSAGVWLWNDPGGRRSDILANGFYRYGARVLTFSVGHHDYVEWLGGLNTIAESTGLFHTLIAAPADACFFGPHTAAELARHFAAMWNRMDLGDERFVELYDLFHAAFYAAGSSCGVVVFR